MNGLFDLTDLELTARQHLLKAELKQITDLLNDRKRRAISKRLRSLSEAGEAIRAEPEPDDLAFD